MTALHSLRKGLDWLSNFFNKIATIFLVAALAAMTVVVFAQVVFRFLHQSLPWSEEFARYLMIYLTYIGASVGVKYKSHIAVEAMVSALPAKVQQAAEVVVDFILLVAFYILIFYGYKIILITMMQKSPAMHWKMGYVYASIVLGGILMTVHTLNNIVADLIAVFTRKEATQE